MRCQKLLDRARLVLKSTGTLGEADADKFIDNFFDEVERDTFSQKKKDIVNLKPLEKSKERK